MNEFSISPMFAAANFGIGFGSGFAAGIGAGLACGISSGSSRVQRQISTAVASGEVVIQNGAGETMTVEQLFAMLAQKYPSV